MSFPVLLERHETLESAARRIASSGGAATAIGGGLDLLDPPANPPGANGATPNIYIPVRQIPGLSYIETRGDEVRIGAATTIAEIAESHAIRQLGWPLSEAAAAVGSPQIREQATLAGNLLQRPRCWYFRSGETCHKNGGSDCPAARGDNRYHAVFGDGPCWSVFHSDVALALHALAAAVRIHGPTGERDIPIDQLYAVPGRDPTREHILKPGEIIRDIRFKALTNRFTGTFMKVTEREGFDFALASVALVYNNFHGKFKYMRMYLGGVAPGPHVPQKTVDALQFKALSRNLIPGAAELATVGAKPLAENAYKIPLIKNLVRTALFHSYERLSWKPD